MYVREALRVSLCLNGWRNPRKALVSPSSFLGPHLRVSSLLAMEPQDPDATHGLRRCASAPADLLRLRERDTFAGDGRNETQEPPVEPDEAAAVTAEEVIKPLDEFEDFLQKKAYSNNQAEQLYHAYKAIKNIPSYDMLRSLVYLDKFYEAMPMKFENCDLGMVSFEALLHGLEEFLQKPLNQEFRLWYVPLGTENNNSLAILI